jgi:hypothetical protein
LSHFDSNRCAVSIQIDINEGDGSFVVGNNSIEETPSRSNYAIETPKRVRFHTKEENETEYYDDTNHTNRHLKEGQGQETTMSNDNEMARKKSEYISSLFPNSVPSPIENVSYDGSTDAGDISIENKNLPLPPFSPGVPGLLSPFPRKPNSNFGGMPPQPPSR